MMQAYLWHQAGELADYDDDDYVPTHGWCDICDLWMPCAGMEDREEKDEGGQVWAFHVCEWCDLQGRGTLAVLLKEEEAS